MKKVFWICPVIVAAIILVATACKKEKLTTLPDLANISMTVVADTFAVSKYKINSDGGAEISASGVCWSITAKPDTSNSKTSEGVGIGTFTSRITGLTAGTTYYIRAYARNSAGISYTGEITFTTRATLPILTTSPVSAISVSSATSGGNISSDGGGTITARGICWSTAINPTTSNLKTTDGTGSGLFVSNITGLKEGTVYHVRAYATNAIGTVYGSDIAFSTDAILPVLTSSSVSAITATTASCGGNITSNGGATVTARGVCWSITSNPTTADTKTTDGVGNGQFVSNITGLSPGSAYHLRAYATNSVGTAYGADMQFSTLGQVPVCVAQQATNLTISGATLNGIVNANYLSAVVTFEYGLTTAYGQTIAAAQSPVTGNSLTNVSSDITGLTQGTTYHFRVKSVNSLGTVYSGDISFVTPNFSILNTTTISAITYNSATSGGNIITDGGSAISARGVCWNATGNPTVSDPNTTNGTGTGTFTSSLTGLLPNTLYYVRAYATSSVGTSYGNQLSFTTSAEMPTNGLLAYYPFNGNANDESGNGHNGSVNGASLTSDRFIRNNSAYSFNGTDNFINLNNLGGYSSHSYSGWFKIEGQQNGWGVLVSKLYNDLYIYQNSEIRIDPDSGEGYKMSVQVGSGTDWVGPLMNNPVSSSAWHHFVFIYNDDVKTVTVYLDNSIFGTTAVSGYSDVATTPTYIGARPYWNGPTVFFFNGKIDDVRIYNRALNVEEINALYHEGGW